MEKATQEQRDEIINKVIHNKYEFVGTDVLKVGEDLFIIDHTDRDDLYKSYWDAKKGEIPDGQGYGIRKKYKFAELTKEDLHEIITNISSDYNYSETRIREVLQNLGVEPGNLLGIDFAAAIRERTRNNALGNAEGRRRGNQADKNTSSAVGRENQGKVRREIRQEFRTKDGKEVYGFVAGVVFLAVLFLKNKNMKEKGFRLEF